MEQDLVSPAIYSFKSLMMCFSGAVVGVLGGNARKLMGRILNEEREKTSISKLFGQFVSEEVKDKIVSQKAGLVAEKRNVAILFSDIRSFTTMSEKYDPEHIVSLLNRYFDSMVDAITKNGGTVDKFIGDAVMAYFGGLYEIANPSASALKAAIAMRANLKKLNQELKNDGIDVMENGIGIHFGEVVLGALGSIDRKDFTCIGDAVNIASRLEGLTKDFNHSIVVSRDVYTAIESDLQPLCISLGKVNVKGKSSAIEIYGVAD
jgi:class 3 adenylate cyclase